MMEFIKRHKKTGWGVFSLLFLALIVSGAVNGAVIYKGSRYFYTMEEEKALKALDADCILVLGAWVRPDGSLSNMLHDRVSRGIELFRLGAGKKLLMSGDHGTPEYDEVNAMKAVAKDAGIAGDAIFMDHAGFSTYESMYRAKEVFGAKKIVIVTQKYHLYRAVAIARALGLDAFGVPADQRTYEDMAANQSREFLARVKDAGMGILKPKPTFLGEAIPISGSGTLTDDRKDAAD